MKRVVFVLVDGARPDVMQALLDRGDLPNLARHVIERGGYTTGTTVFPSTTGVGYIPFLFGRYPGTAGIPGIRWLDRARAGGGWLDQWTAARSYCGVQGGWINKDIQAGRSLFEMVRSEAICTPITRGLSKGAHRIALKRMLLGGAAHYNARYAGLDEAVAASWVAALDDPWRFMFVVFPGVDGLTHFTEPWHESVLGAYRAMDRALGTFLDRARKLGEPPHVIVASDHGAGAIRHHEDIAVWLELHGAATIRHPVHVWRRNARAAVMVSGNASVQIYLDPRSGDPAPGTESSFPPDLIPMLSDLPAVRLAAFREDDGALAVVRKGERARLDEQGGLVSYTPVAGDPLELGGPVLADDREMLALSRGTSLPDSPRQILQLFATSRAGEIMLAAESGYDFRGPWEIPEHHSGHGSLTPDHMLVPVAATIPLPESPVRTVDLMPTILELLGEPVPPGLDGVAISQLDPQAEPSCDPA
ncbi:MAG: alkaline phosphatase family protein [Gemmatimonadales bacterium]